MSEDITRRQKKRYDMLIMVADISRLVLIESTEKINVLVAVYCAVSWFVILTLFVLATY